MGIKKQKVRIILTFPAQSGLAVQAGASMAVHDEAVRFATSEGFDLYVIS
ncbi:hypothetical protein GCM10007928_02800 [Sulfitobacter porphyrae]|nr:hypothetical protein GCM10007928_02800 [Sulfitobacter porphyrae]